jgi:chromosome segregation ATPase
MEEDYVERVKSLRSSLDKASARKEDRENELKKIKKQYQELVQECKNTYNCEPKDLKDLIAKKEEVVSELLEKAESCLEEVNNNLGTN